MKNLIEFVSQKSNLPPPTAEAVAAITLEYLEPHCSPLLKSSIEVLLNNPDLSEAQRDLLIATRVLMPLKLDSLTAPTQFDD